MKLYCLSKTTNKPCFILKFKSTYIMFDCGLDLSSCNVYVPHSSIPESMFTRIPSWDTPSKLQAVSGEIKEINGRAFIDDSVEFISPKFDALNASYINVLLISNYHTMLALPYFTEYSKFSGLIYATEPTLHIGRLYMEELVYYLSKVGEKKRAYLWKDYVTNLPMDMQNRLPPQFWRKPYNIHDVHSSLSKVRCVRYNEIIDLFGTLKITACSSGYCLGSCNWIVESDNDKFVFLGATSTLTTHPRPAEQNPLKHANTLLVTSATLTPNANPDVMIGEFCMHAAMVVKGNGNVIVPCHVSGITYDLFECLSNHLDSLGISNVHMYFISPSAKSSLAYSSIYAEWLSKSKQDKVYLPESPFPHAELVQNNKLVAYNSISEIGLDMKTPCVVFVGHPCLRFGDVVHFIELWGKSSANAIIFTEPEYSYIECLAPFQPLQMKVFACPIDTNLSFSQLNKLLSDIKPQHIVVPKQFTVPPMDLPSRLDLVIDSTLKPIVYNFGDILSLPIKRTFCIAELEPTVAKSIQPQPLKTGPSLALVTGILHRNDNHLIIKSSENTANKKFNLFQPTYAWGEVNIDDFVNNLKQRGLRDIKVEKTGSGGHIVDIQSEDTLIHIETDSTHIVCNGNEAVRTAIRDCLLASLSRI